MAVDAGGGAAWDGGLGFAAPAVPIVDGGSKPPELVVPLVGGVWLAVATGAGAWGGATTTLTPTQRCAW